MNSAPPTEGVTTPPDSLLAIIHEINEGWHQLADRWAVQADRADQVEEWDYAEAMRVCAHDLRMMLSPRGDA